VSLAAQSLMGRLAIEVFQEDVVGEMAAKFWKKAERCSCLETSSSRVYDLILWPVNDRVHLAVRLDEAAGQLQVMQDEHRALQNSVTRVQDLVLKRSDEAFSLVVALSLTADLIEDHVDAVAANGVHSGAWLALTAILSHFPELERELELLGSEYNADLTEGQLEAFWALPHWASESLSSRVPPSVAHSPTDGAGKE
jgi:hypothetical protein